MAKNAGTLSRAGWVRFQVLTRPTITLKQLQTAYDKTDFPKEDRPDKEQVLHSARSQLKKRWGLDSLEDFPRRRSGQLNIRGCVWRYFEMYGDQGTYEEVRDFLGLDGMSLDRTNFTNARIVFRKREEKTSTEIIESGSPDPNQDAGPRAGKPKRKYKRRKPMQMVDAPIKEYEQIERALDDLRNRALVLKDNRLAAALLEARRRAGAYLVTH